jgi:hypothetical protein
VAPCTNIIPDDQDGAQQAARADLLQNHVARNVEKEIADEEHAGSQAVDRLAHAQILLHLKLGEGDIDPVDIGHNVAEEQERHQPEGDFAVDGRFEPVGRFTRRRIHRSLLARRAGEELFRINGVCTKNAILASMTTRAGVVITRRSGMSRMRPAEAAGKSARATKTDVKFYAVP